MPEQFYSMYYEKCKFLSMGYISASTQAKKMAVKVDVLYKVDRTEWVTLLICQGNEQGNLTI